MTQRIVIANNHLVLHPLGGLFWEEAHMLCIADVHLGKVAHFRKFGAAVPAKAATQNFVWLNQIAHHFKPQQICFLGDLFHSALNNDWHQFAQWVQNSQASISLIIGNHDIIAAKKYQQLGVKLHKVLVQKNFLFTHHPQERQGLFNFCGHIHPAVRLQGFGRQKLKLPCFFKTKTQLILPAFGAFTGNYTLTPKKEDDVYVLADGQVLAV